MRSVNIAIDGPSGAGKSTLARAVAEKYGLIYLDTGAMYRAAAYFALENGVDPEDEKAVKALLPGLDMRIAYKDGVQQIYISGENVTPYLRLPHMSKAASDISAHPAVRLKLVEIQREFAATHNVVLDGRDIGTFVLPDASCKIYLTADPEVRARRRTDELIERGTPEPYEKVLEDMRRRDHNDSHRAFAPAVQAKDAVLIDTTHMTVPEVVARVGELIKEREA